jgi:endonuclease-3
MTKQERYLCYKHIKRTIPYNSHSLDHKDPYTLLKLLSAQCTDVRVNKITPLLLPKQIIHTT